MLTIAKYLIVIGIALASTGGILFVFGKLNIQPEKFPGTIVFSGVNFSCMFALGLSLLISIVLTLIINIVLRLNK